MQPDCPYPLGTEWHSREQPNLKHPILFPRLNATVGADALTDSRVRHGPSDLRAVVVATLRVATLPRDEGLTMVAGSIKPWGESG